MGFDCFVLSSVFQCILKLSKLELLKLSNNALEEIPEGIGALSNLQELVRGGMISSCSSMLI